MTQFGVPQHGQPQVQPLPAMAPGWYADPQSGQQKWWDGYQWAPQPPAPRPQKKSGAGKIVLIVVGVLAALLVIGAVAAGGKKGTDTAASPSTNATTPASPVPAAPATPQPESAAPAAPPAAIPLSGKGGTKTQPFSLQGGVQYRVDYEYGSAKDHGIEQCIWMPMVQSLDQGIVGLETLPNAQGALKGSTSIYPRETGAFYLDTSATLAACSWSVTLTPAG